MRRCDDGIRRTHQLTVCEERIYDGFLGDVYVHLEDGGWFHLGWLLRERDWGLRRWSLAQGLNMAYAYKMGSLCICCSISSFRLELKKKKPTLRWVEGLHDSILVSSKYIFLTSIQPTRELVHEKFLRQVLLACVGKKASFWLSPAAHFEFRGRER